MHVLNVVLVAAWSSRSVPGNKEFSPAKAQLWARDFSRLSSRVQEKRHPPVSQVLHLRMNLIGDYLQRVCCPLTPTPLCSAQEGGEEGVWGSCFLSKPVSERETPLNFFFFRKQILCQICNEIQIEVNARSKGSQRELFILKTTFPPGQEVPACAWRWVSPPWVNHEGLAWFLSVDSQFCWAWLLLSHFILPKIFQVRGEEKHVPLIRSICAPYLPGTELIGWVL